MFERKNIFYKDLFTEEECLKIKNEFFYAMHNGAPNADSGDKMYNDDVTNGSFGITDFPESLKYVDHLTEMISKDFQIENWKIEFENSFIRIYKNGCHLKLHNDRKELDITLSVNIAGIEDWALNISNVMYKTWRADYQWDIYSTDTEIYKTNFTSYKIPNGCGIACYGRSYPHWRDTLVCKDDEYVIQLFYHWSYWKNIE
jgi:hypothetical protein